jgi:hypothetical protein
MPALVLFASSAAADDPAPEKPVHATANVGYVQTGGNTEVVTLLAADKLEWKQGVWRYSQEGAAVYGQDHGVENAGRYGFDLRADYSLSSRVALYGLGSWRRDVYAGVQHQYDEGAGVVYHAIVPIGRPGIKLASVTQRRSTVPDDESRDGAWPRYQYPSRRSRRSGVR